ncbi:hypothetical protein SAY86_008652 [Trapa natans]|uniref:PGG domain-containing protein n=1 Tax=Trapa natans TaxID=22666 RepID=A0AAN7KD91_TRANT|nr:hypothetical protein SAY86_008652 [Trapa natans]
MDIEDIKKLLFSSAMKGKWDDVVRIYQNCSAARFTKITRTGETALHMAVSDGQEDTLVSLVGCIANAGAADHGSIKDVLEIKNDNGNTALHYAAMVGSVKMCECIARQHPGLVGSCNNNGETPLFFAALHGKKEVFMMLHGLSGPAGDSSCCQRQDGWTVLHSAINGEYFDLAFQIIHLYEDLVHSVNKEGLSPLHLLAMKASSFRSGKHLGWWRNLIYHCIFVDQLKVERRDYQAPSVANSRKHKAAYFPQNYGTCIEFYKLIKNIFRSATSGRRSLLGCCKKSENGNTSTGIDPPTELPVHHGIATIDTAQDTAYFFPSNYWTCFEFIKLFSKVMLVLLGQGSDYIKKIREKKEKNTWSIQVMNELVRKSLPCEYGQCRGVSHRVIHRHGKQETSTPSSSETKQGGGDKPHHSKDAQGETAILLAAKNGITEMVEKILEDFPVAIHDMNSEHKNIVLLAVENRQPHVYELLLRRNILADNIFRQVDSNGNSALHLAAMLRDYKPWLIPGAALQMQWEIKWFKFVKTSMPPHFFDTYNKEGKTARTIFTETHRDLLRSGRDWLTSTSESCSVVAALIATVAFATSTAVPGGVRDENGMPRFEDQPAFDIFAISSLVALCFSVTSVVLFLSILTSRYQEKDFGRDLPKKLLVGLTSLFVSIASMLVSFCAGHFFVLKDKLKYAAYPVYAVTCLPVTLFAMAQFPLYLDLIWATFKKVPQRSYK